MVAFWKTAFPAVGAVGPDVEVGNAIRYVGACPYTVTGVTSKNPIVVLYCPLACPTCPAPHQQSVMPSVSTNVQVIAPAGWCDLRVSCSRGAG